MALRSLLIACVRFTELEAIMNMHIPEWIKPASWGAAAGAVVVAIVGLSAGWVVTSGAAKQTADRQAEKAIISALAPICVAQFKSVAQAEQKTHLAALQKEGSWERGDYVEKQGWATMPGANKPNDAVAEACASELLKLGT
jgi:hypothetical protein